MIIEILILSVVILATCVCVGLFVIAACEEKRRQKCLEQIASHPVIDAASEGNNRFLFLSFSSPESQLLNEYIESLNSYPQLALSVPSTIGLDEPGLRPQRYSRALQPA
jgi:hypothetical protein